MQQPLELWYVSSIRCYTVKTFLKNYCFVVLFLQGEGRIGTETSDQCIFLLLVLCKQ